jgi:heterodisulfide reductase subunit B/heterodisulfide reductase subunit C
MTMFWGCTIPLRFPFLERSLRLVLPELGLEAVDTPGYTCCPEATLVRSADEEVYYLTAARNLAVAAATGLPLLTPCNGCYSTFRTVLAALRTDWRLRRAIELRLAAAGLQLRRDIEVWHLVEWLSEDLGPAALGKRITRPFWGMRLAVHYGCHLLRPSPAVRWDSPLAPTKFEQLVRALGATVVDYDTKLDCCGNALDRMGERSASLEMLKRKLRDLDSQGVDALVVSCPSCFLQFDLNQATLIREAKSAGVPVFYLTELIGLGLGLEPDTLALGMHRVGVEPFLAKWRVKQEQRAALASNFELATLQTCASCRACDADCPVRQVHPDFVPSQVLARLLAGELDQVVAGPDPWRCVDCMTCFERCHSRLGMAKVFEKLRRLARERQTTPATVSSSLEGFLASGTLGMGRTSARERLGLPELPPGGLESLRLVLSDKKDPQ